MTKSTYKKREIITLVELAQRGDIKALEELIKRVQKNIFDLLEIPQHLRLDPRRRGEKTRGRSQDPSLPLRAGTGAQRHRAAGRRHCKPSFG